MNAGMVFCIEHEEMTHMECGELCGHIHYVPVYDDGGVPMGVDVDFCDYPSGFAFVAPPADEPEWEKHVVEPEDKMFIEVNSLNDGIWTSELAEV